MGRILSLVSGFESWLCKYTSGMTSRRVIHSVILGKSHLSKPLFLGLSNGTHICPPFLQGCYKDPIRWYIENEKMEKTL